MSKSFGCIYKVGSPSGKIYISQTVQSLKARKSHHLRCASNPSYRNYKTKFNTAIRKYDSLLQWGIIESNIPIDLLGAREQYYIQLFDSFASGYNGDLGGRSRRGYKHSEEAKQQISTTLTGRKLSDEQRKHISEASKGRIFSPETREKLRQAALNHDHN